MNDPHPQRSKSHCPKGHEYTPENTMIRYRKDANGNPYTARVCRTCNRARSRPPNNYTPKRLEAARLAWLKPERHEANMARRAALKAINNGTLIRKPCEVCGNPKVHAHHDDYSKPLEVRWLCSSHHVLRHLELGWGHSGAAKERVHG